MELFDNSFYEGHLSSLLLQKRPGSPKQQNENSTTKPPLPINTPAQFRKGAYHESLDFVQSLCETSYGLVDIFPIEDRKIALREVVLSSLVALVANQIFGLSSNICIDLLLIFSSRWRRSTYM